VQRGAVVLQHGSILLDRLPFDELDLLRAGAPTGEQEAERATLRARSVTLAELGATTDPAVVAASIVAGFESTLDLRFESRVQSPE
jgi:hypothetical protein